MVPDKAGDKIEYKERTSEKSELLGFGEVVNRLHIVWSIVTTRENGYTGSAMNSDCVFCKIVKGELPSTKEYEDDNVLVFKNINPIAPVHVLIIPKHHIKNISDIVESDKDILGKMLLIAKEMSVKLGISDAFRVAIANGENAGQSVFHLHLHLTGGWKEKYNRDEDKA